MPAESAVTHSEDFSKHDVGKYSTSNYPNNMVQVQKMQVQLAD